MIDFEAQPLRSSEQTRTERSLQFTGNAGSYFRIWLVNLVLSIVTVGVYSAWAKVRSKRYFLGHTVILGDRMDYHATGFMILKGRLIAVAMIAAYVGLAYMDPLAQPVATVLLVPIYPLVVNQALRFNARMTSWRTIRLNWHGTYWGVTRIFLIWPTLAVLTLGLLAPLTARIGREYIAGHYALGTMRFTAQTRNGPYWGAYLSAILLGLALALLSLAGLAVFFAVTGPYQGLITIYLIGIPFSVVVWGIASTYFWISARNIMINGLSLGDVARFRSSLRPLRYVWIVVTNLVLAIASGLLLLPWATVRRYRYQAECLSIAVRVPDMVLIDHPDLAPGAIGEEYGALADIEIDL